MTLVLTIPVVPVGTQSADAPRGSEGTQSVHVLRPHAEHGNEWMRQELSGTRGTGVSPVLGTSLPHRRDAGATFVAFYEAFPAI